MKLASTLMLSGLFAVGASCGVMAQDTTEHLPGQVAGRAPGGAPGVEGAEAANRQIGERAPPSEGGAYGVITGVSAKSFTLLAPSGRTATVATGPDTTYRKGKTASSAGAIKVGDRVRILGAVARGTGTNIITATHVVLQPIDGAGSEMSLQVAAAVSAAVGAVLTPMRQEGDAGQRAPGQRQGAPGQGGADNRQHHVGQVPAGYVEGVGTIVVGTEADKATEAGMATPWSGGGMVNRVVKLSDGTYEVHNGSNWPHHIYVNADFKATGAD
jgi:hypothetical protein